MMKDQLEKIKQEVSKQKTSIMASILWYQPAIINADDIVSCNGVIQQNSNERTSCFRQLNQIADKVIGKKKPWCGKVDG